MSSNDILPHPSESEYDCGPFGPELPSEVQFTSKLLSHDASAIIPEPELRELCQLCYSYVTEKRFSRVEFLSLKNRVLKYWKEAQLITQLGLNKSDFDRLFAGLLKITECIGRNFRHYQENRSSNALKSEISRYSKLSDELSNLLFAQFYDQQSQIPKFLVTNPCAATGYRLISMRWRIDVVISDRFLSKIMEPVVRFEFVYQNGGKEPNKKVNFECRLPQFHRLRFMTTNALKELGNLELKVANVNVK